MGSNEMLFIPHNGSHLLQTNEQNQQHFYAPGPKIAYSYQHDPKHTPMRKISSNSVIIIFHVLCLTFMYFSKEFKVTMLISKLCRKNV